MRGLNEQQDLNPPRETREARQRRIAARGPKEKVDPWRPVGVLVEEELGRRRVVEPVTTIFLANRECPFHCAMCDLWKHTLDEPTPRGAIPTQMDRALQGLPRTPVLKLYNAGNFFDPLAIPESDYEAIRERMARFEQVVIENHPRLTGERCREFLRERPTEIEVAMGLETIHEPTLSRLDKQMTSADFARAAEKLLAWGATVRAFIVMYLPGLVGEEAIEWTIRSVEFATAHGVDCCSIIPLRSGNGWIDQLVASGETALPTLEDLERVIEGLPVTSSERVFVDLWDAKLLAACEACRDARIARLRRFNLTQQLEPAVTCEACG